MVISSTFKLVLVWLKWTDCKYKGTHRSHYFTKYCIWKLDFTWANSQNQCTRSYLLYFPWQLFHQAFRVHFLSLHTHTRFWAGDLIAGATVPLLRYASPTGQSVVHVPISLWTIFVNYYAWWIRDATKNLLCVPESESCPPKIRAYLDTIP